MFRVKLHGNDDEDVSRPHRSENRNRTFHTKLKNFCTPINISAIEFFHHKQKKDTSSRGSPSCAHAHSIACLLALSHSLDLPTVSSSIYIHSSSNFHSSVRCLRFLSHFRSLCCACPTSSLPINRCVSALDEHETCFNKLQLRLLTWQTHPFSPMDYY